MNLADELLEVLEESEASDMVKIAALLTAIAELSDEA
jgi:hypothetical protein